MMEEELIAYVFDAVKTGLTERLRPQGYLPVEELSNDPVYGSRHVIWSNNVDVIRLTWDGKESVFVIEVCDVLPLTIHSKWTAISLTLFNPALESKAYVTDTIKRVIDTLN
jgi:predicted aspartyl protease